MSKVPSTSSSARFFLGVLALLWFAFGLIVAASAHPSYRDDLPLRLGMTAIAWGLAAGLAVLARRLRRANRPAYWITVALLSFLILVGLFDELGLADLVYLVLTFIPLALLLKDRYRGQGPVVAVT